MWLRRCATRSDLKPCNELLATRATSGQDTRGFICKVRQSDSKQATANNNNNKTRERRPHENNSHRSNSNIRCNIALLAHSMPSAAILQSRNLVHCVGVRFLHA